MRKGAYSNKYKAIEAGRINDLKNERNDEVDHYKEKEKHLARETNRRRRFIKEKKRSFSDLEEARRQRVLESRRKRQLEATHKFQRQPIIKPKFESTKNEVASVLADGIYNIRGHIVEIKDGIRVSPVVSQSSNQHMRNNSTSENTKTYNVMNGQYGSHAKNSIYSGREYLLNHLNDLSSGKDKKLVLDETEYPSQIEVNDNLKFDELQNQNLVASDVSGSSIHTPSEAPQHGATSLNCDKSMPLQPPDVTVVNEDGLEAVNINPDQAKCAELARKSSLKRQQPPGSPTKEKRKVKFNRSIEFNDGFIWMLKDNEEKATNGGIKAKVSAVSSPGSVIIKEKVVTPVPSEVSLSSSPGQLKDFSYPETVDLGLPTKLNITGEDGEKNVEMKEDIKDNAIEEGDIKHIPDANLFDSLEASPDITNQVDDAVEKDSLEFSYNEVGKPDVEKVEQDDAQNVIAAPQIRHHPLPVYSAKDSNENDNKDVAIQERRVQQVATTKELRGTATPLASFTKDAFSEKSKNSELKSILKGYSARDNVPHTDLARDDFPSRKTYELSHSDKSTPHTRESSAERFGHSGHPDLHITSMNRTNSNVSRSQNSFRATMHNADHNARPAFSSTTNYVHQIDAESSARGDTTGNGSHYLASRNLSNKEDDHGCFVLVQYHGSDASNIDQSSYFPNQSFQDQTWQLESDNVVNTYPKQFGSNFNVHDSYSFPKASMQQDRQDTLYEGQSVVGEHHRRLSDASDTSKLLFHQSENLRHHAETLRNRNNLPTEQQKLLRDESQILQHQSHRNEDLTGNNPASIVQYRSKVLQDSDMVGKNISVTDSELDRKQKSGSLLGRDTGFLQHANRPTAESDEEDEVLQKIRKSMAELQFNKTWRPESAIADNSLVSQDTAVHELPRPSIKGKTLQVEFVDDSDKIKLQSKLTETSGKKSNIPVRVQSAPTTGLSQNNKAAKTPQKAGIVPHPPMGPKGLFTRKMIRQGSHNRRNSPMRVTKPHANAGQGSKNPENVVQDNRLFTLEGSAALGTQNVKKIPDRMENRDFGNAVSQGDTYMGGNSAENGLNKTPTDDEIDNLWHNVRNCLTTKPPAKASSDSVYIVPPWKQNRTWSGTIRGRSNSNRQFSLYSASSRQGYPLRRYGSQDNLMRRENSLDNLVMNSNTRGRPAVLMQRSSKPKITTNFQAFTTTSASLHKPYQSEKTPDVSKAKSNDMSESLASFLALEAMCEQESLSPHRTSAVLKASQNVYYQMQRDKISAAQQLATTRRQEPSALSVEERKIMESLERLNTRLREKESEARKYEANSAWNQKMANGIFQEANRMTVTNGNRIPKNYLPRGGANSQQHPAYRY